jgi:CheY-like chemotaxis protein
MVEDSEDDALLVIRSLEKGGYEPEYERVETAEAMRTALCQKPWDVILCDYRLPRFNGLAAIALLDKIHTSNALIDRLIRIVRRISTDLRPSVLDDLGLIAALEWQLSEFTSRTDIQHGFATTFEYVNIEAGTAVAVQA